MILDMTGRIGGNIYLRLSCLDSFCQIFDDVDPWELPPFDLRMPQVGFWYIHCILIMLVFSSACDNIVSNNNSPNEKHSYDEQDMILICVQNDNEFGLQLK